MKSKIISFFSSLGALIIGCFGGTCGIACFATGCCGSFALLGFLGISGSSLLIFEKLTPIFLILTIISLAYAFYLAYKPKKTICCESSDKLNINESKCCTPKRRSGFFKSKAFVWTVAVVCLMMWVYPYFIPQNSLCQKDCKDATVNCCTVESENKLGCCPSDISENKKICCSDFPQEYSKYLRISKNICCPSR